MSNEMADLEKNLQCLCEDGAVEDCVELSTILSVLECGNDDAQTIIQAIQNKWRVRTKRLSQDQVKFYGIRFKNDSTSPPPSASPMRSSSSHTARRKKKKKSLRGQGLPDRLSDAVLTFCRENFHYTGHLSVHGNITVVADTDTTVAFFSKKINTASDDESEDDNDDEDADVESNLSFSAKLQTNRGKSNTYEGTGSETEPYQEVGNDPPPFTTREKPPSNTNTRVPSTHGSQLPLRSHQGQIPSATVTSAGVKLRKIESPAPERTVAGNKVDRRDFDNSNQESLPPEVQVIKIEPSSEEESSEDTFYNREIGMSSMMQPTYTSDAHIRKNFSLPTSTNPPDFSHLSMPSTSGVNTFLENKMAAAQVLPQDVPNIMTQWNVCGNESNLQTDHMVAMETDKSYGVVVGGAKPLEVREECGLVAEILDRPKSGRVDPTIAAMHQMVRLDEGVYIHYMEAQDALNSRHDGAKMVRILMKYLFSKEMLRDGNICYSGDRGKGQPLDPLIVEALFNWVMINKTCSRSRSRLRDAAHRKLSSARFKTKMTRDDPKSGFQ